ncbi:MAG: HXXEE domain-containing protein [Bacteroidetes bacterium]|nr:HXXEE domain-containing protein [Bacteroidota bacterium]
MFLVLVQGLHSIEEYSGRLWENFPPARFLCSLFSDNLEQSFIILNLFLFLFGMLCWLFTFRNKINPAFLWVWIVIEMINGVGHPAWAIYTQAYAPGMITSPILFLLAIYLARQLMSGRKTGIG